MNITFSCTNIFEGFIKVKEKKKYFLGTNFFSIANHRNNKGARKKKLAFLADAFPKALTPPPPEILADIAILWIFFYKFF